MTTITQPTTGTGDWTFRMQHDWLRAPDDIRLGNTHALAQDREGHIHLAHTVHADSECRDAIVVFAPDGSFLRSWGAAYAGGAHGLEYVIEDGTPYFYLTDLQQGLFKLDANGEVVWHFAKPSYYERIFGLKWQPSNVAVAPDGRVFLADGYGTGFIVVLSTQGEELDLIGGPGLRAHNVQHPHGLGIDTRFPEPLLAVVDNRYQPGLHYLTLDGRHVAKHPCGLADPRHVRVIGDHLLIPDLSGRVSVLGPDNALVCHLGWNGAAIEELFPLRENPSFEPGWFVHPHDAIRLADGSLLVCEWVEIGRVTRLVPTG